MSATATTATTATATKATAAKPKKTPMKSNEFYSMHARARVVVDPSTIEVKVLTRELKGGGTSERYQAIGQDTNGKKVYKFISKALAEQFQNSE